MSSLERAPSPPKSQFGARAAARRLFGGARSLQFSVLRRWRRPRLSVVVIAYNMARELPRTIRSLSPSMQRGVNADDYEIILVDNGSSEPFDARGLRALAPNMVIRRQINATVSPVPAINAGLEMARGHLVGVFIDGARIASPGLLAAALAAADTSRAEPVIGTLAFHLGPEVQMQSCRKGYNQEIEDRLLAALDWERDGYRLFDGSVFAGSSAGGWHALPAETNALFLRRAHWRRLGGYDPEFQSSGGGLANLDIWRRVCDDPANDVVMILGEGTFHQVHGGVATNSPAPQLSVFQDEYRRLRGVPFEKSSRQPRYFGAPRPVTPAAIDL